MKLKCKYCGKPTDYCDQICDECTKKIAAAIIPGDEKDEIQKRR